MAEDEGQGDESAYRLVSVALPVGGLVGLGNPNAAPTNSLSECRNVTLRNFCLEKSRGRFQLGNQIPVTTALSPPDVTSSRVANFGYQLIRLDDTRVLLRVSGRYLMYLDDSIAPAFWIWKGVVSNNTTPDSSDVIGNGAYLGTGLQKRFMLFYADGGPDSWVYLAPDPYPALGTIIPWGVPFSIPLPTPTIDSEVATGGLLLSDRNYAFVYQYINVQTGWKSGISPASNVWLTTSPGNAITLNGTIPANPEWTSDWSIVRISRSPGAVPPAEPVEWLFDHDEEGVVNLDTVPHTFTMTIQDGDLGSAPMEIQRAIPNCRYIIEDPGGVRCLAFGNPDDPNVMYWSDDADWGNFPSTNQTDPIGDNDGDPLIGGFVINERIYLVKRMRGIYQLTPTSDGGYAIGNIDSSVGCASFHSVVIRNTTAYWLSRQGVIKFQGQVPVNISDNKVRTLFRRYCSLASLSESYGVECRESGSQEIVWLIKDTDGFAYQVRYDISLQAFTIRLGADGDPDAGGLDRIAFNMLDNDDEDEAFHIITADETGHTFRLDTNSDNEDVWDDAGDDYTFIAATAWYGDGMNTYLLRFVDFALAKCPTGITAGQLRVGLYVDDDESDEVFFELFDLVDTGKPWTWHRFHANAYEMPCRRFRVKFSHDVQGGAPKISHLQAKFQLMEPRL